ncbi:MAG TPA: hypothetical protein VMU82_09595 [Acetobacteraceae bacterium]|nr:hypothetical protein [Acetobacteraceae bacterium]
MNHDPALIHALEPAQRLSGKQHRLPRRKLGRGVVLLLSLLRVYVLIAVPLVIYAFIHALLAAP